MGPQRELFKQKSGKMLGSFKDGKRAVWLKKQQGTEWWEMGARKVWRGEEAGDQGT